MSYFLSRYLKSGPFQYEVLLEVPQVEYQVKWYGAPLIALRHGPPFVRRMRPSLQFEECVAYSLSFEVSEDPGTHSACDCTIR